MGQRAQDTIVVERPAEDVMAVIVDLEQYPAWAEGVEAVEVLSSDDQGRPLRARFRIDAKVFQLSYVLEYQHVDATHLTWKLVEGEQLSQLDGSYVLTQEGGRTRVDYALEVDIDLPLPGFMKKRGAKVIMETGLRGLKRRVEEVH